MATTAWRLPSGLEIYTHKGVWAYPGRARTGATATRTVRIATATDTGRRLLMISVLSRRIGQRRAIQLVEFDASHSVDEVREAMDAWLSASRGKRPLQMALVAADHDRPNHYWNLLMFPSEQEATEASQLPETQSAFENWSRLLDGEPVFHNLDVVNHLGGPSAAPVDPLLGRTPGAG